MTPADEGRIDRSIVAALYAEHAAELHAFLLGVLRDSELAADALQATFAKAVELGHTAREESRKPWLFRVALNEALVIRRRQGVENRAIERLAWIRPRGGEGPDDALARRETVERVREALAALPVEQRRVVEMRVYDDKTFAVIAHELGLPLGTVLSRMQLALKKLRSTLESK
jgi:RNA polymerase sigma-70 factor (ECF subfamily)